MYWKEGKESWPERGREVDRRNKLYFAVPDENKAAVANCRPVVMTTHYCIATNTYMRATLIHTYIHTYTL